MLIHQQTPKGTHYFIWILIHSAPEILWTIWSLGRTTFAYFKTLPHLTTGNVCQKHGNVIIRSYVMVLLNTGLSYLSGSLLRFGNKSSWISKLRQFVKRCVYMLAALVTQNVCCGVLVQCSGYVSLHSTSGLGMPPGKRSRAFLAFGTIQTTGEDRSIIQHKPLPPGRRGLEWRLFSACFPKGRNKTCKTLGWRLV
jgi:hypothetical protein